MINGKKKALTFSFDDGVKQDLRLIELLNKYRLKATFNLNSALLGTKGTLVRNERTVNFDKISVADARRAYEGHEVAAHTLSHPTLVDLSDEDVVFQIETDRKILSDVFGYEVVGMAYPGGCVNNDERVAKLAETRTGIKYARTITSSNDFSFPKNLFRLQPSVYYIDVDNLFSLAKKFLSNDAPEDSVFYIWGHSFEMDAEYISWDKFEEFCRLVSNQKDVFYGTNREILLK